MSEHRIDVIPNLIVGRKSDGRCVYDREAKEELVSRCQQPGVSVAGMALACTSLVFTRHPGRRGEG